MKIFSINQLEFEYPESERKSLNNINLNIEEGEFVTLCGASGCGKSTLLRHLKSVLEPAGQRNGEILFMEKALTECDERSQAENIGFVSQNPDNQIVTDKVWHELAFGLESLGYDNEVIRQRVAEMAAFFGIEDWFYRNVSELSGGQKQLLCLASIMTMLPKVIIPTFDSIFPPWQVSLPDRRGQDPALRMACHINSNFLWQPLLTNCYNCI